MKTERLDGKVALVTGASSGIGEATARALAAEGATVVLAARRKDRIEALAAEIGNGAHAIEVDLVRRDEVERLAAETLAKHGRVDILVNNAGVMHLGMLDGGNPDEWRTMLDLNLYAPMVLTHALLPSMKANGGGHIVNVSSVAGRTIRAGAGAYNVTKWGLNVFSEALRQEVTTKDIRITIVEPGAVATELDQRIGDPTAKEQVRQFLSTLEPLQASDIANAILYAVTQPAHVSVNEILVRPTHQDR